MVGMRFLPGGAEPVLLEFPQNASAVIAKAPKREPWLAPTTPSPWQ